MNNAVYGKTCENLRNRIDVRLVNNQAQAKRLIDKPNCKGFKIINENLVAIQMAKTTLLINKPTYVGFCVLELSKLHMYEFHYNTIKAQYGRRATLLFTDTDSLCYEIETEDVYKDFSSPQNKKFFDFASYPKNSPFYDSRNNKIIGKFKDEVFLF